MTNVVITLGIATEALAEQSDSTWVTLIEDTLGAPREGEQWLDQMHSSNFFFLEDEVSNSNNFVLNKYKHVRGSLFKYKTYNKLVVHNLFNESILGINIEVK